MSARVSPALAELLGYLGDIGYRELYLPRGAVAAAAAERDAPRPPTAAADPPRTAPKKTPALTAGRGAAAPGLLDSLAQPPPKWASLGECDAEAQQCTRCRLAEGRRTVVFGVGDPDADLMFIGEGPGAEEDRRGEPFVGAAGQLLDKIIAAIGLERGQVYIANVVKCRPPGNRDPLPDEVAACRDYLEAQIDLVRPKVIVALGRVAAQCLLGTDQPLGRLRGVWHRVRAIDTRVTYHPAGLLRNRSWKRPCWEDMQAVRDRLGEER